MTTPAEEDNTSAPAGQGPAPLPTPLSEPNEHDGLAKQDPPTISDILLALGAPDHDAPSETSTQPSLGSCSNAAASTSLEGNQALTPDSPTADGSICEIQTLYEGPYICKCCKNWVTAFPDDVADPIEASPEVKQKALIVRMRKDHDNDGRALALDSIVVQSASLKETIAEVFSGYRGITAHLKKLVFHAPFRPFYYRWQKLEAILDRQKSEDPDAAALTQLLYNVLDAELHETISQVDDLLRHSVVTHELLWALFEPKELVVAELDGHHRFFLAETCDYDDKGFVLSSKFIDWDGERFGYAGVCARIPPFAGTRRITELGVFPARFHESLEEVTQKARERGRKFVKLRGFHYMAHSGMVSWTLGEEKITRSVIGRIIVDAEAYFNDGPRTKISLSDLDSDPIVPEITVSEQTYIPPPGGASKELASDKEKQMRQEAQYRAEYNAQENERRAAAQKALTRGRAVIEASTWRKKKEDPEGKREVNAHSLTDDQLLLCEVGVRGYCLKLKKWLEFHVDNISDITWNDTAFESLELPNGLKSLILAFVKGHSQKKAALDDVIEGKGQGMIVMLAGNPGTGKTLTGEAVADELKRPLYIVSAGELGSNPWSVEDNLKVVLGLAEKWNAILLLDECDVFIQHRSAANFKQSETVAVFLRLLEYFRGVMIMTTNRLEAVDPAMHSRFHLTLQYPDLSHNAKERVWRQFVYRSGLEHKITDENFESLARLPLNGRQIKNLVKISAILASTLDDEPRPLGMEQIREVLQATKEASEDVSMPSPASSHDSPTLEQVTESSPAAVRTRPRSLKRPRGSSCPDRATPPGGQAAPSPARSSSLVAAEKAAARSGISASRHAGSQGPRRAIVTARAPTASQLQTPRARVVSWRAGKARWQAAAAKRRSRRWGTLPPPQS